MTPWQQLLHNLAALFNVKTIVTLVIVLVFCIQVLRGEETSDGFLILAATAVINYYFTKGDDGKPAKQKSTAQ